MVCQGNCTLDHPGHIAEALSERGCCTLIVCSLGISSLGEHVSLIIIIFLVISTEVLALSGTLILQISGSVLNSSLLSLLVVDISIHEKINHNIPTLFSLEVTSDEEVLSSEEPEHKSDGLLNLVVARDGNVNELQGRVRVAKGNDWDVHVGSLTESLMIDSGVADDQKSWLDELLGDLVGKHTRGPLSTNIRAAGVGSELEDGSLSVDLGRGNKNILRIVDTSDDSSGNHEFLPGLGNVQVVAAILVSSVDVRLHLLGAVGGTNVDLGGKHKSEILLTRLRVGEAVW